MIFFNEEEFIKKMNDEEWDKLMERALKKSLRIMEDGTPVGPYTQKIIDDVKKVTKREEDGTI